MNKPDVVHFRPFNDSGNVRCLNGSAHANRTSNMAIVTCPKCLKLDTNKEFWQEHEQKHGNVHKVF